MCRHIETEAEKNASSREKLSAALYRCDRLPKEWCDDAKTIMAAARLHLSTLPLTKKVWRVSYSHHGGTRTWSTWPTETQAVESATCALRCGKSCVSINSYDEPF